MLSIYLHIPFCRERCRYCDFFLVTRQDHIPQFFDALAVETEAKASLFRGAKVKAIHIGGGTPSMVPVGYLESWLEQLAGIASVPSGVEIALEANPEDLDTSTLDRLASAGINRLSIGAQSFTDRKLRALGRVHTAQDSERSVRESMERFNSVSVDLICGAEGEELREWVREVGRLLEIRPPHISVYMLTLEEKTRLWREVRQGRVELPGETLHAAMYDHARRMLDTAGYRHYEISNYAVEGHQSGYNLATWLREPYLGFGPSAHSFMVIDGRETRFANAGTLVRYLDDPAGIVEGREILTPEQRFDEEVFLSLRINRGLSLEFLRLGNRSEPGELDRVTGKFLEKGWVRIEQGVLYLTGKGFLFADLIAAELM